MKLRKPHRLRVVILGGLFCVLAAAVGARLVDLQLTDHDHYTRRAQGQHVKRITLMPERGAILDRNGDSLARSTERVTVYINPSMFRGEHAADYDPAELHEAIAAELGEAPDEIERRFSGNSTIRIAQRVMPDRGRRVAAILARYEPSGRGHWMVREATRLYPKQIAAGLIGFCQRGEGGETPGLAGLELSYNEQLSGRTVELDVQRSGARQILNPWSREDIEASKGNTLVLTIDSNVQDAAEQALAATIEKHAADSGGVVVLDPHTGGIIAMANFPTFDNNNFASAPADSKRTRTITDPFETGSVVKLFTAAMLFDLGLALPDTMVDCGGGFAVVDGRRLRDSPGHYLDVVTFREAMRWSSNIGIARLAIQMENPEWYDMLRAFGFGAPTGVDLPGEGGGILHPLSRWTRLSRTSLPMGYEIGITPLQTAAALAVLVNGGVYYRPHLVSEVRSPNGTVIARQDPEAVRRVLRPVTSQMMRDMMEDIAVLGTGKKARIDGYRIGGKTGTTRKSDVFHTREYIASFGGALPIDNPRVVVYVYIDNPSAGEYYASSVAAPLFQEVAAACVLHLGIAPSEQILPAEAVEAPIFASTVEAQQNLRAVQNARLGYLGLMPDFTGLSASQVRTALPPTLGRVRIVGTGQVVDQFPPPGEPLGEDTLPIIQLAPPDLAAAMQPPPAKKGAKR